MFPKLSLQDVDLEGCSVLMRVDFNVPLDENLNITDDTRIRRALKSVKYVLEKNAKLIVMSHLGRPKGERNPKFSLKLVKDRLEKLTLRKVIMAADCVGEEVEKLKNEMKKGEILLLENLRFHEAEVDPEKDLNFAENLAKLGDIYVNDAFGAAHRDHSSITRITKYFPNKSVCGFLLKNEIEFLGDKLKNPEKPFYAIIGGAKVSSKIGILKSLLEKVDGLVIGGAMANTFLKAQGVNIGSSFYEEEVLPVAERAAAIAKKKGVDLILPIDLVVAKGMKEGVETMTISIKEGVPSNMQAFDIGPKTIEHIKNRIKHAKTVLWNGPLGVFEIETFAKGTNAIARLLKDLDATTIIGGGDSVAAINKLGISDKMSHISTGGGASLEYIEHGSLPGIEALTNNN